MSQKDITVSQDSSASKKIKPIVGHSHQSTIMAGRQTGKTDLAFAELMALLDKTAQEFLKTREVTIDGFTYDLCDFCDEIATRGTISIKEHASYCDECYLDEDCQIRRFDEVKRGSVSVPIAKQGSS